MTGLSVMQLKVLKSKLHMACVTRGDLNYHGSLTLDPELMEAVGILPYEAILVSNLATGLRAETYVLVGRRGSGQVELNGAMAQARDGGRPDHRDGVCDDGAIGSGGTCAAGGDSGLAESDRGAAGLRADRGELRLNAVG